MMEIQTEFIVTGAWKPSGREALYSKPPGKEVRVANPEPKTAHEFLEWEKTQPVRALSTREWRLWYKRAIAELDAEGERADEAEQTAERYRVAIMRYCNYECEDGKSICDKPSCALNVLDKR